MGERNDGLKGLWAHAGSGQTVTAVTLGETMDKLMGHPVATPEELLPLEIKEWIQRWKDKGLTLAQARTQAVLVHADIGRIRGRLAADAWWQELIKADRRLQ